MQRLCTTVVTSLSVVVKRCRLIEHIGIGAIISSTPLTSSSLAVPGGRRAYVCQPKQSVVTIRTVSVIVLLIGLIWGAPLWAANLYKYRDANGRWVMTDKKPQQTDYEQQQLLFTQAQAKVAVVNRGSKERPILFAVSHVHGPVQVRIEFSEQDNVLLSQTEPLQWLVNGPGDQYLMQLQPKDPNRSWRYQWRYDYTLGPPKTKVSVQQPVIASPVAGGPFWISQGFMGEASHSGHPQSHYAVDIVVPADTPIIAVAAGQVMDVERDFSRAGWSKEYADEANFVRVLHSDGIMAVYAHLRADGIEVVPGQHVKTGQLLGYSGNTGYSSGPHLHFALQVNRDHSLQSIPFEFHGIGRSPRPGDRL